MSETTTREKIGIRITNGRCPKCAAPRGQLCVVGCPNSDPRAPGQPAAFSGEK